MVKKVLNEILNITGPIIAKREVLEALNLIFSFMETTTINTNGTDSYNKSILPKNNDFDSRLKYIIRHRDSVVSKVPKLVSPSSKKASIINQESLLNKTKKSENVYKLNHRLYKLKDPATISPLFSSELSKKNRSEDSKNNLMPYPHLPHLKLPNKQLELILTKLKQLNKFTLINNNTDQPLNSAVNKPKSLRTMTNDFQYRVKKQEIKNQKESKLLELHMKHQIRVNRFSKMLDFLNRNTLNRSNKLDDLIKPNLPKNKSNSVKQIENIRSNSNRLKFKIFGINKSYKTIVLAASNDATPSSAPTASLFSTNSVTGEIQNVTIAFKYFKERMEYIGNQYTGETRENFFQQLNDCPIDRFEGLSTEKGRMTIYGVREAEVMLQSEFEGHHAPNSIIRPPEQEYKNGNVFDGTLDGKFRIVIV